MDFKELNQLLNKHFNFIQNIILSRQNPITGLLPASTAVNAHGDYTDAWVRDNVYSILSTWGLALAYKKYYPMHFRSSLLSQSVVKLMRGLLISMMKQSQKVERFKKTLNPADALHAKYSTTTGLNVVADDEWGHLQLDATSLFVLMLAQMTASGLQIIYTLDEVNFVQNLVHYISRTYCTPDYGIWERGNKINHGMPEINCSSVGMAKAALEAISGFNLFGNVYTNESVIHVVPSDIAHSRMTLHGLLPRESNSKETDAALLSIIGYPAYAVEDEKLVDLTKAAIFDKLVGPYGLKRFLLDGHQSGIEDPSKLHYEPSELRKFEHIEPQWPLFYTYLLLDALMRHDTQKIEEYKKKLDSLCIEKDGQKLLPELYFVHSKDIEAEKKNPGSKERIANENLPLVWAQSLYMLSDMIIDGILDVDDIDPLKRHKRLGYRRVAYPTISILAENSQTQETLLKQGINAQTVSEVRPIKILEASELSKIHTKIGQNQKLGLTGRPYLIARTITTARLHIIKNEQCVFLPYYLNPQDFYFSYDNTLLATHFKDSLSFLSTHWNQPGQPVLLFLVKEDMLDKESTILRLLHQLQNGFCNGVYVKTTFLKQAITTADTETIVNLPDYDFKTLHLHDKHTDNIFQTHRVAVNLDLSQIKKLLSCTAEELTDILINDINICRQAYALKILSDRHSLNHTIKVQDRNISLQNIANLLYEDAAIAKSWSSVRQISDIIDKLDERLEDSLLDILIAQKRLAVGRSYSTKAIFSQPRDNKDIVETIKKFCGNSEAEAVLTQEMILHLGHLIRIEPKLFKNMITLKTWHFVQLLAAKIGKEQGFDLANSYMMLLTLAPHEIYALLKEILQSYSKGTDSLFSMENMRTSAISIKDKILKQDSKELNDIIDWASHREHLGMIGALSKEFYAKIWHLLQQCNGLIIGDKFSIQNKIGSELTLESTAGERAFALKIEELLQSIDAPSYRQLNIEAIQTLIELFEQNPNLMVSDNIILDALIGHAVRLAWIKHNQNTNYEEQKAKAWEDFYRLSPDECSDYFIEAFKYLAKIKNEENV